MKYYKNNKKNRRRVKREKIKNRHLVKQYPWLLPRNVWTGKVPEDYDYSYINWGCTRGWDIAYGDMYLKELGSAIEEAGLKNTFMIYEIKEKYGQHRLYHNGGTKKINNIVSKYERLSENICIGCGKPDVPMINDGWLSPWCYDCWRKMYIGREKNYKKYQPKYYEPSSEEEIKEEYDKCICSDNMLMANTMKFTRFSTDGDYTYEIDISETADKIRKRWSKRIIKRAKSAGKIDKEIK